MELRLIKKLTIDYDGVNGNIKSNTLSVSGVKVLVKHAKLNLYRIEHELTPRTKKCAYTPETQRQKYYSMSSVCFSRLFFFLLLLLFVFKYN